MTKRIVVPLDGSTTAEMALPHAVAMSRATGYGIVLLRVVPPPVVVNSSAWTVAPTINVWEDWEEEVNAEGDYLAVVGERLRNMGIEVTAKLLEDDPASAIVYFAEHHPDVAMVVMSTHGRGGLSRWLLGSVAEKVLHALPVPLLLVRSHEGEMLPPEFTSPEYRSLLVPLDGSAFAEQALKQAEEIAAETGARITLVTAVPEGPVLGELVTPPALPTVWEDEANKMQQYLGDLAERLRADGLAADTRVEYGPPADVVLHVADGVHADLIVMATHGRSGLPRLWLGSVAMKTVQVCNRPVLLVRARQEVKQAEPANEHADAHERPAPAGEPGVLLKKELVG
jgi:nucleotide-binding universal stress UspA family protein